MTEIPNGYPHNLTDEEIQDTIDKISNDIMPIEKSVCTTQHGSVWLLKLGKIQLGIMELQGRESKRTSKTTKVMAIISIIIAVTALVFTIFN